MLEVSESNISRIEKGRVLNPGLNTVVKILSVYDKTLADLHVDMFDNVISINQSKKSQQSGKSIPVIALNDVENYLNGKDFKCIEELPIKKDQISTLFAVKMTNDFMKGNGDKSFPKGSYVIFEPKKTLKSNAYVLAGISGKISFFKLVQEDDQLFALTLNTDYTNQQLAEQPKIFARAIECRISNL